MAKLRVHGGDFGSGDGHLRRGQFLLPGNDGPTVGIDQLDAVEITSEEKVTHTRSKLVYGAIGFVVLGPLGLVIGLLLCGRSTKDVTFSARFQDGRRLLATTDSKVFAKIQASCPMRP